MSALVARRTLYIIISSRHHLISALNSKLKFTDNPPWKASSFIMAGYFEEMGWTPLGSDEQPDHLLHMARFLVDFGLYDDNFSGEWPRLPPPASRQAVDNLPEITVEGSDKDCPICLKKFHVGEKAKQMPCQHVFHSRCILTWLDKTNSCPFCRHELPTDHEGYEAFKKEKKRAVQRKEDLDNLHNSMFS